MIALIEVLNRSKKYLESHGVAQSRLLAEELLCGLLRVQRIDLYVNHDRPLDEAELSTCRAWLSRCAKGEPVEYITGRSFFFDTSLQVSPAVLIPRQETEILVDRIVQQLALEELAGKCLWDVCCGSGCIAIAVKKRLPQLDVWASDYSQAALEVARKNAKHNQVELRFLEGDLLQPFADARAHYVVCNPPYVTNDEWETLEASVRCYEPKGALVGGADGLDFYRRLAQELPPRLFPGAKVWLEMGSGQGEALLSLFQGAFWKKKRVEKDWAGHDRFFFLEIE